MSGSGLMDDTAVNSTFALTLGPALRISPNVAILYALESLSELQPKGPGIADVG
jgi:hypothetical protein